MDQVEEVKQKTNIVNLIGEYVSLKKAGRNHRGLCPFHGEKTPSFMVNEELSIYKCFGCGAGGDAIKFLMEIEGLEFREALKKLADRVGVKLAEYRGEKDETKTKLLEAHHLAAEYYHYLLAKHPAGKAAREYLAERGIKERLIETFRLGWALPEWEGLVKYLVGKKGYHARDLVEAGLAIEGRGGVHDRFRGRIMFPLLDSGGKVVGFSGRILPGADKEEPKYLNSPETVIYHKGKLLYGLPIARVEIKKKKRVICVEGQMDMISSYGAGVGETVAVGGTALTPEMIEMLARLTETLILAMDNDEAGEAAMKRSMEQAEKRGVDIKMVQMEGGKDPDEIAQKSPSTWREMVDKAVPVYEFFFDRLVERYGTGSVAAISSIVKEMVPLLAKIENSVIREVWMRKLAERIGVDKQRVWEEVEKRRVGGEAPEPEREKATLRGTTFLGALLTSKTEERQRIKKLFAGLPAVGAEGKLLLVILEAEGEIQPEKFLALLPAELKEAMNEAVLAAPEAELSERELTKLASEWGRRILKEKREAVTVKIRQAEQENEAGRLDKMLTELVKLNTLEKKLMLG